MHYKNYMMAGDFIFKFIVYILLCLFTLTSCATNVGVSQGYSLEDAKKDNLVVYEDSDITAGQLTWDMFVEKAQTGTPSAVKLAFYYTLDGQGNISDELYDEIKDDYPQLYIQDLNFNGEVYTLYFVEKDKEYTFEYKYLKRFEEAPMSATATYSKKIQYVLVNDNEVTLEQIFHGMVSSQSDAWIDHKTVYSDYIYKGE